MNIHNNNNNYQELHCIQGLLAQDQCVDGKMLTKNKEHAIPGFKTNPKEQLTLA
jgi:hypothetical protein